MILEEIEMVNQEIQKRKERYPETPTWSCGFVGSCAEWDNFLRENKDNIKHRTKDTASFLNGERWTWLPEGTNIYYARGERWSKLIVPMRIDSNFFFEMIYPKAIYCVDIKWY